MGDERTPQRRLNAPRRTIGFVIRTGVMLVIDALVLVFMTAVLADTQQLSFKAAVLVSAVMAIIFAVLWPFVTRLALPLTIITFGLGSLALSAGVVALAFWVVD